MTTEEFLDNIKDTFDICLSMAILKNKDYAWEWDPFRNFNMSNQVWVSPERAILVRLSDKISRISNLLSKNPDVKSESIKDTIQDSINYLAILSAYLENKTSQLWQ
jgi:hypothetical protein